MNMKHNIFLLEHKWKEMAEYVTDASYLRKKKLFNTY